MSDHLLRLAKLAQRIALESSGVEVETHQMALNLVRDLAAAPPPRQRNCAG